ncbi:MAG: hypothetical protein WA635_13305 [Gallionella sp.]
MSDTPAFIQSNKTILISALTGVVLATGIVVLISSEKAGGLMLSDWQNAAIYVAVVAASILIGVKICTRKSATDKHATGTAPGKLESSPS